MTNSLSPAQSYEKKESESSLALSSSMFLVDGRNWDLVKGTSSLKDLNLDKVT